MPCPKVTGTGEEKESSVPEKKQKWRAGRVQEKKKHDLYPRKGKNGEPDGYRRRKRAICTREKAKMASRTGTGAGKMRSVPEGEIVVNKYGVCVDIHLTI